MRSPRNQAHSRTSSAPRSTSTSWQEVSEWYGSAVGQSGHYYHQHVVLPQTLQLLQLRDDSALLDIGCGQGVLARQLPPIAYYQGLDVAGALITQAKELNNKDNFHFTVADATKKFPLQKKNFTHAVCILALQNMEFPERVFQHTAEHLENHGRFLIVLNHPCFRIPRQSSWGVDTEKKTQYRRIDRYLSPLKIPITAHPGQKASAVTWSFHFPLSSYTKWLQDAGFVIEQLVEWSSDKTSVGKAAKMENRSRSEIPLFLTIVARKESSV